MDNATIKNYILLLELPLNKAITLDDIKRAYRRLSKKYHPDTAGVEYKDGKKFTELTKAKDFLTENIDYINRIISNGQINSKKSAFNLFEDSYEDVETSWYEAYYWEQVRREAQERARKEEEARRKAEEIRRRQAEEERKKREAEEKRRKEEYERKQREEAERKFQYNLKKDAILNDIKAFHSSLKKDDYFVNDYTQINEDIMTFTRNVNNNVYSSIQELTNAYNNVINKIKAIKTISQVKTQKRRRNTIISCLSAIAAVVVFVVLLFELILPTINYNKAVDLLEQNKYEEAGEIFEDLDGFKDSNEQVIVIDNELKYQNAVNLLNNNQLIEAKQIFVELNGFRESNTYIKYVDAMYLLVEHKYTDAQVLFTELNDFRDSKDRLSYANTRIVYEPIYDFLKAGKTKEAIEQAQLSSIQVEYDFDFNGADSANEVDSYDKQPVKIGYNFVEWGTLNYNLDTEQRSLFLNLKAMWEPRSDIPYKINRYFENIENNNYTLSLTEELLGMADSIIMPEVNTYPGFTSPTIQTAKVNADGSLVIEYYYTRNYYEINFITNGGENIAPLCLKYQDKTIPNAVRTNYTFGGWYTNEELTCPLDISNTYNDVTIYAYWKEETKPYNFTYKKTESITITSCSSNLATVVIPSFISGLPVDTIENIASHNCRSLTSVTIPDSVTSIGDYAFYGCDKLIEVYNQSTLTITAGSSSHGYVGRYAKNVYTSTFGESKLSTDSNGYIIYTDKEDKILVSYVGHATELTLPEDITKIYQYAFSGCGSLTSVTIGDSVTSIGVYVFYGCNGIKEIYYSGTKEQWDKILADIGNTISPTATIHYEYQAQEE